MAQQGEHIAAIVIEPVLVTGRVVPPVPGFSRAWSHWRAAMAP